MPHLLWADPAGDRMFIEAAMDTPDRPTLEFVSDGEQLLERCAASPPDLIVLDLDLPRVSGLDVLAELRARRNTVPIVVFSKTARAPTIEACHSLGVTDVIEKPSEFRAFREGVQRIQALSAKR